MPNNPNVIDTTKPEAIVPDTSTTPVTEPMIWVSVLDRLQREIRDRLFPSEVAGIIQSATVGETYWMDQLWSIMVNNWPRLQTNLGKLRQAVSSMEYAVTPYSEADNEPSDSAMEKADFVKTALFGMHSNLAKQEHDFHETLEDIVDSLIAGFTVMEVDWESRNGGIVPQCTRWLPARYYRYPYIMSDSDRLMLNPSGNLGSTQLVDFPDYKFLICIKQSHANHPVFTAPMRCLTAWWISSRFGLEWFQTFAQLFGVPQRIAYYQPGDDVVYQQLVNMMRQAATATWGVYPKGTDVQIHAHSGSAGAMPQERLIEQADKVCDIMLLGQTLTTEVRESGGNRALGTVHRKVMDEVMEAAAKYCAKLITAQIIPGIVQYNFGNIDELPVLEPVINTPIDLFNLAQSYAILFGHGPGQLGIPVLKKDLYARIEFTVPEDDDDIYQPPDKPAPAPNPFAPSAQPEGLRPEPAGAPNGEHEPLAPNIVERVGATNGHGPDDDDDPDDGFALPVARKVSFALDYGEEPEPGEVLRFVEGARHDVRHPKTGRFIPKPPPSPPKRKVGVKRVEPMPEVGLMCKENIDVGDDRVCQACKDISAEGWIPVDEEFLGYSMNPPHHPNCLTGDALISPASEITAVTKRWFKGKIRVIRVAGYLPLEVTPNHPILTARGWVKASLLDKSDRIICSPRNQWIPAGVNKYGQQMPARIEDIVETFLSSEQVSAVSVPTATKDFYGDGIDGQVCVIGTNSALRESMDSACLQHEPQLSFVAASGRRRFSLAGSGGETFSGETDDLALAGDSGGFCHAHELFWRATPYPGRLLLSWIPQPVTVLYQDSLDWAPTDFETFSDSLNAYAREVEVHDLLSIEVRKFSGHVYDLECSSHYYIANGIAVHNCRCSLDYKTAYKGVDIYHATKSGNPHHHPETGRFVSKPGRKVRAAFDPSELRDEEGKWTSEGGEGEAKGKKSVFKKLSDVPGSKKTFPPKIWKSMETVSDATSTAGKIKKDNAGRYWEWVTAIQNIYAKEVRGKMVQE